MQNAQSRTRSRRWIGRGALVALAGAAVFGISPALPALAATWSSPVTLPGSCGSSVAVNQAGAMAAGGTFTASDGTTHVQVCTSSNGKTWQATDLGQGGNTPSSGHRIAVAVTPAGQTVAVWGYWPCSTCTAVVEAAVHPAGGSWGAPVTLSTGLGLAESDGGLVIGTDGAGNVIAGWSTNPGDATDAVLRAGSSSWGPAATLSVEGSIGQAHALSLAVNSGGSAIITFNGGLNSLYAVSGTVTGGFSAPVWLASGAGSNHYNPVGTSQVALNNAGQASVAWSVLNGQTGLLTRSPSGAWTDTILTTRTVPAITVSTAIDGAGNAIAVFGSSYSWDLAGGSWKTAASLPSGSSGGLAVADPAGTFVYADSTGNAFTFTAGATSFGTGSGSHGGLADLKIVPGQAVLLAADAVSAEPVS
ncbi:MAG TPA: hypothetical protein VKG61_24400 [Streptosporangiaceae bacterium]|nr:hypothetical protein [Streptosporangiaceae bacterium]